MTLKYDAAGHQLAAERAGDAGDDQAFALALDGAGNVYVAGFSVGDGFVTAKYVQHPIPTQLGIAAVVTNGAVQLTLTGEAQRRYEIQASSDLTRWAAVTNFFYDTDIIPFADATPTNITRRFYRAVKQ